MRIRKATNLDQDFIHNIHWSAFPEDEREIVSTLAVNLLSEETSPQTFSWVAETEDAVVGHVAFSPVTIGSNPNFQGYILSPLGVKPAYQKRRIGSNLIKNGTQQLSKIGVDILFVYGDPDYYSRFGFSVEAAKNYIPPYNLEYPSGWQGITLSKREIKKSSTPITCVSSLNDPALW